ncbi:MAG: hypothetical protein HY901_23480 [Deltaproteobacteria bacterium]|nr:hypothetical protein [Deltaproteobacteria bacterium]
MTDQLQLDAVHLSFPEIISEVISVAGAPFASGALVKIGLGMAKRVQPIEFPDWDQFLASLETLKNPIAQFEGKAKYFGDGVFGLPGCPFAGSVNAYKSFVGAFPESFARVAQTFNKPSEHTERLRVGHGAGVSPFCCVHQPVRSALADRMTIGGKAVRIYQLGCKAASGTKGLADKWIEEAKVDRASVEKVLEENMCCYCLRVAS